MGMFDHITCEYPLPDKEVQDEVFQTKSMERHMDDYVITKEGRLVWHRIRYESVPEEERPYYGTNDWDDPLFRMIGSMRSVPVADIDMHEHGTIRFYILIRKDGIDPLWAKNPADGVEVTKYEYEAKFMNGNLVEIKRLLKDW